MAMSSLLHLPMYLCAFPPTRHSSPLSLQPLLSVTSSFVNSRILLRNHLFCATLSHTSTLTSPSELSAVHSVFDQEQWEFPELVRFVQDLYGSETSKEAKAEAEGGILNVKGIEDEEDEEQDATFQKDNFYGAMDSYTSADEEADLVTSVISNLEEISNVMEVNQRISVIPSDQKDSYEIELAMKYKKVPHNLWITLLKALCRNGQGRTAINLINWIRKHRFKVFYDDLFSVVIEELGKIGRFSEALSFADQLERKGYQTYDALIRIFWKMKDYSGLLSLIKNMRQEGMRPDHAHYTLATQACIKQKLQSPEIVKLYEHMLEDRIHFDEKLYNDVTYAIAGSANAEQSLRLLQDMKNCGFIPSGTVYTFIMFALCHSGRTNEARHILKEMKGYGRSPNLRTYNTLIKGYAAKGQLDLAEEVMRSCMVDDKIEPNEQTYSILIDYQVNVGELEKAWSLFQEMKDNGLQPDAFVYGRLMTALKGAGRWVGAMRTLRKMEEEGIRPNRHVYNIAIDTFGKHRKAEKAREIFMKMRSEGIEPDIVTWNSLIECHFRSGQTKKALQVLASMKSGGVKPSSHTYNILIDYLGRFRHWEDLRSILDDMKSNGLVANTITYTTLVDVYGQSQRFQDAFECLEMMRTQFTKPEPSVYCALANAYARQGLCEQAMAVFKKMEGDGIETNIVMLNSVLNSFSVAAKPEEGLAVFEYMHQNGIKPDLVTYTTLMKGFINAEKFDEALFTYDKMIQAGLTPDRKAKNLRRFITKYSTRSYKPHLN